MKRTLAVCLLAFTSTIATAGEGWKAGVSNGWHEDLLLWFPPGTTASTIITGPDPAADYAATLKVALKKNANAAHICAATALVRRTEPAWLSSMRGAANLVCSEYPAGMVSEADLSPFLYKYRPRDVRYLVARLYKAPDDFNQRLRPQEGLFLPRPFDIREWDNFTLPASEYREKLQSAFDNDPPLAAAVCEQTRTGLPSVPSQYPLRSSLLQVCAAFPDQKIEMASHAMRRHHAKEWLFGVMNGLNDAAAKMSPEARAAESQRLITAVSMANGGGQELFVNVLRAIALRPDDWRAPLYAQKYHQHASFSAPHPDGKFVLEALGEFYASRAARGSEATSWKRGWAGMLFAGKRLEDARKVSLELFAGPNKTGLDTIRLAFLERALGDRKRFDAVLKACPKPDLVYVQQNGVPQRAELYCESQIAELALAAKEILLESTPEQVWQMYLETNRTPGRAVAVATSSPKGPGEQEQTEEWFGTLVKNHLESLSRMSRLERHELAYDLRRASGDFGPETFESALRLLIARPEHEAGVASVLRLAERFPVSPSFDKRAHVRKLVQALIEKQANSGDADWSRASRNYLLMTGEYSRSLELARAHARKRDADDPSRDVSLLALLERINGNQLEYERLLGGCPGQSAESLRNEGRLNDPSTFCRSQVWWATRRALAAGAPALPAFKDVLKDMALRPVTDTMGIISLQALRAHDPNAAERAWQEVLGKSNISDDMRQTAYEELALLAYQSKRPKEGLKWSNLYLQSVRFTDPGFDPAVWTGIANTKSPVGCHAADSHLELRIALAIQAGDITDARQAAEWLAMTSTSPCGIRRRLIEIAGLEQSSGRIREARRIASYVASHAYEQHLEGELRKLLSQLGENARPFEPVRESAPWDSKRRLPPNQRIDERPKPSIASVAMRWDENALLRL